MLCFCQSRLEFCGRADHIFMGGDWDAKGRRRSPPGMRGGIRDPFSELVSGRHNNQSGGVGGDELGITEIAEGPAETIL